MCIIGIFVALTVGATVFFRVERISVSGGRRYTQEDIIAASGIQIGDNLYALNKVRIDRNIRTQLPYVGELSINRVLPSTIVIQVTEWEAVAQIAAPDPAQAAAVQEELAGGEADAEPAVLGQEPWLINARGKLLEPAPKDSRAISVTGLTPVAPQAGNMLETPESEKTRLEALTALLGALEQAELFSQVSSIHLESTQLTVRYLDRFDVKMRINADFSYSLRLMQAVRKELEAQGNTEIRGSMDLTQKEQDAVFSPEK
jgi:cell division protein FtsQ